MEEGQGQTAQAYFPEQVREALIRTMEKIKVYMRGWLNYYGIADMKNNIESLNGWLVPADTDVHLENSGNYPEPE